MQRAVQHIFLCICCTLSFLLLYPNPWIAYAGDQAGEVMHLAPQSGSPGTQSGRTESDITVTVPLFPGATPVHVHDVPAVGVISADGLYGALREYTLPASSSKAMDWYRDTTESYGFVPNGSDQNRLKYVSSQNSRIEMNLTFYDVGDHTIVQYWVTTPSLNPALIPVPDIFHGCSWYSLSGCLANNSP